MNTNVAKVPIIQQLNNTAPSQLVNLPEVAERFQNIFTVMNGGNKEIAKTKYEAEKFHFAKLIQDKPDLQACTKLSLYGCFLDMAVNGLSFDPNMKHAYVVSFNTNVGTKNDPRWEKRATLMISGYGELHMRIRQGQIKYADNPILVYEGDEFRHGTRDGKVFLEHMAAYPRQTDNIIASYIRLERTDGSVDYKVLSIEEVMKLKKFSKDPNSKAWTDGLPGMIQAKTIKHAFKSYPKTRLGQFSQLQSETVDTEHEVVPIIDYGIEEPAATQQISAPAEQPPVTTEKEQPVVADDSFVSSEMHHASNGRMFDDDQF